MLFPPRNIHTVCLRIVFICVISVFSTIAFNLPFYGTIFCKDALELHILYTFSCLYNLGRKSSYLEVADIKCFENV